MPKPPDDIEFVVANALAEDLGGGDLTGGLIPPGRMARARLVSRESAVLCGRPWFDEVYRQVDEAIGVEWNRDDGERLNAGDEVCRLRGPAAQLLSGERTALNFLQTLSGTATRAREYTEAIAGTGAQILDTRKTLPGLRRAQKYAVVCGGGRNHRMGLWDAILIKENHIMAAGSISAAVGRARELYSGVTIEVEVENLTELEEALAAQADIVMLDNFDVPALRDAVATTEGRAKLEASGNVTLETIRAIALTGVDFISVGTLTKDLHAIDLSMRFEPEPS